MDFQVACSRRHDEHGQQVLRIWVENAKETHVRIQRSADASLNTSIPLLLAPGESVQYVFLTAHRQHLAA